MKTPALYLILQETSHSQVFSFAKQNDNYFPYLLHIPMNLSICDQVGKTTHFYWIIQEWGNEESNPSKYCLPFPWYQFWMTF